jgi:hypothetical protein
MIIRCEEKSMGKEQSGSDIPETLLTKKKKEHIVKTYHEKASHSKPKTYEGPGNRRRNYQ